MRKEICANENDKYWNLPIIIELNGKNTIISIWYFNRKRYLYGRLIKHKPHLCANGGMHKWGVNYWETYYPVVNWMSVRAMITLSILREIHTNSIGFVFAYTQGEILMVLPIGF